MSSMQNSVSGFLDQSPYSDVEEKTVHKKHNAIILYSPSKADKENGFDVSFNHQESITSVEEKKPREPLSPSKLKAFNNGENESRNSQMSFSPKKGSTLQSNSTKEQLLQSKDSSMSPSKFVKIDLEALSNPFRSKKTENKAFVNSKAYLERVNAAKENKNVEVAQPKQRRAKSDRKNKSQNKSKPAEKKVEVSKPSVFILEPKIIQNPEVQMPQIIRQVQEPQIVEEEEMRMPQIMSQRMLQKSPDTQLPSHAVSLTLTELQNEAELIQQNELKLKVHLDQLKIPSFPTLNSVESAMSQQTAQILEKYAKMMQPTEHNISKNSHLKNMSNYDSESTHLKSVSLLQEQFKSTTSCNVEYENFYEQEIKKLKTDLEGLKKTEEDLMEDEQEYELHEDDLEEENEYNEESTQIGNGLFHDDQEFQTNLHTVNKSLQFNYSTGIEEQRVSVLDKNSVQESMDNQSTSKHDLVSHRDDFKSEMDEELASPGDIDMMSPDEIQVHLQSNNDDDIAIVTISPQRQRENSFLCIHQQDTMQEQPESGNSFKIQLSCILESPSNEKSQCKSQKKSCYNTKSSHRSPFKTVGSLAIKTQGSQGRKTPKQVRGSPGKSSNNSSPKALGASPQKYEQDEFMLHPKLIVQKKSPIKARRDKKISPKKSQSPHKYFDPNLSINKSASRSPQARASPSMKSGCSPQTHMYSSHQQSLTGGKKERRSKKNRSISTKNGGYTTQQQPKVCKPPELRDFSKTCQSFDNRSKADGPPDFKNHYVFYKSPKKTNVYEEDDTKPIWLSQGIFDRCFEQSQITQKEISLMNDQMISPTNIVLPVNINDHQTIISKKDSMTDMMSLQQQQEPLDSPPPKNHRQNFFKPQQIKPQYIKSIKETSRKNIIEEAERQLRITESKVDLFSSRNNQQEMYQRSFYGEELNERPQVQKKDSRASIGSFQSSQTLRIIKSVQDMNNKVVSVNQKIKDKYAGNDKSYQKYLNTQKSSLQSDTYFQKPEDLRSRTGSKIGCGLSKAMSASKTPISRISLAKSSSKPVLSQAKPMANSMVRGGMSSSTANIMASNINLRTGGARNDLV